MLLWTMKDMLVEMMDTSGEKRMMVKEKNMPYPSGLMNRIYADLWLRLHGDNNACT